MPGEISVWFIFWFWATFRQYCTTRVVFYPLTPTVAWASECLDVKNYKWQLNSVWHRMLYSCTHMATVGVKGLMYVSVLLIDLMCVLQPTSVVTSDGWWVAMVMSSSWWRSVAWEHHLWSVHCYLPLYKVATLQTLRILFVHTVEVSVTSL